MQMSRKSAHFGPSFEDEISWGQLCVSNSQREFKRHLWRFIANLLIFCKCRLINRTHSCLKSKSSLIQQVTNLTRSPPLSANFLTSSLPELPICITSRLNLAWTWDARSSFAFHSNYVGQQSLLWRSWA